MRVFVTGATGFIGRHLVQRLVHEGHSVRCLVRKTSDIRRLVDLGVDIVYGDVNHREALISGMEGCEILFHLANLYSMWEPNPRRFTVVNVEGTRTALECALEAKVERVVYLSTVAVYGKPVDDPFNECSPHGPVHFSEYARTKAAAEKIAWDLHRTKGLPLVVLYPAIVLGAGDNKASGQYVQDILHRRVPGTIFHQSTSTYVAVCDVVEAILRASENPAAIGQKFLIGKTLLSGKEFVETIRQISGVPLPLLRFPDWMVLAVSYLLTWIANRIHRPPLWGLSVDAGWTLKHGFRCDGSKAERELGLVYTPVRAALEEAISSYRIEQGKAR